MSAVAFAGMTPIEAKLIGRRSAYEAWSRVGYYTIEPEAVDGKLGYFIGLRPPNWSSGSFDPTAPSQPRGIAFKTADSAKRWAQNDVGARTIEWLVAERKREEDVTRAERRRSKRRSR